MSEAIDREHETTRRRVARAYRRLGYKVVEKPSTKDLPAFLSGLAPDLIALKDGGNVVVEIERADRLKGSNQLTELASRVDQRPDWRFELHALQTLRDEGNHAGAAAALQRGLTVVAAGLRSEDSGMRLMAWLALGMFLQRVLPWIAVEHGLETNAKEDRALVRHLAFEGVIDEDTAERLEQIFLQQDDLLAGRREPPEMDEHDVSGLLGLCHSLYAVLIDSYGAGSSGRVDFRYTLAGIATLPEANPVLYVIVSAKGRVNYIGFACAGEVQQRMRQHLSPGPRRVTGERGFALLFSDEEEPKRVMRGLIEEFRPRYNRVTAADGSA